MKLLKLLTKCFTKDPLVEKCISLKVLLIIIIEEPTKWWEETYERLWNGVVVTIRGKILFYIGMFLWSQELCSMDFISPSREPMETMRLLKKMACMITLHFWWGCIYLFVCMDIWICCWITFFLLECYLLCLKPVWIHSLCKHIPCFKSESYRKLVAQWSWASKY